MSSSLIEDLSRQFEDVVLPCPPDQLPGLPSLVDVLAAVPDPRSALGRRYRLSFLLAVALLAVLGRARSLAAVTQWARNAEPGVIVLLGGANGSRPSRRTIARALARLDTDALDDACYGWLDALLAACEPQAATVTGLAVDGKTVRGAKDAENTAPHLPAAVRHDTGTTAGQRRVDAKSNEITAFTPVLDTIDVTGLAITADALHTQREHAVYLHRRNAFYVFYVMGNQPNLFAALDALPWEQTEPGHTEAIRSHSRIETRTIRVRPAPKGLRFPHVRQVFLLDRYVTDTRGNPISAVAVLGITSLTPDHATPRELAELTRDQWSIEAVHQIRDTAYAEDASRVRTGNAPRAMATLRNLEPPPLA